MNTDPLWHAETELRRQAKRRKTVDLGLLRQYVLGRINVLNQVANTNHVTPVVGSSALAGCGWRWGDKYVSGRRLSYLDGANKILEDMMFTLDMYHGYNSRNWCAFTSLDGWYEVVKALQDIDDGVAARLDWRNRTNHYWTLLRILDWHYHSIWSAKTYYKGFGGATVHTDPTEKEIERAQRILDRYKRVLGLS